MQESLIDEGQSWDRSRKNINSVGKLRCCGMWEILSFCKRQKKQNTPTQSDVDEMNSVTYESFRVVTSRARLANFDCTSRTGHSVLIRLEAQVAVSTQELMHQYQDVYTYMAHRTNECIQTVNGQQNFSASRTLCDLIQIPK